MSNADMIKFVADLGVKFPVMDFVAVNGLRTHPLFSFLKSRLKFSYGTYVKGDFTVRCDMRC